MGTELYLSKIYNLLIEIWDKIKIIALSNSINRQQYD